MTSKRDVVLYSDDDVTSGVYEVPDPQITKVTQDLLVMRMRVRARCEPGLVRHVEGKRLSPDKEQAKLRAYGEVLAMLTRGELRDDDLHAIKVDWSDAVTAECRGLPRA